MLVLIRMGCSSAVTRADNVEKCCQPLRCKLMYVEHLFSLVRLIPCSCGTSCMSPPVVGFRRPRGKKRQSAYLCLFLPMLMSESHYRKDLYMLLHLQETEPSAQAATQPSKLPPNMALLAIGSCRVKIESQHHLQCSICTCIASLSELM